ncbi:hypothetical protein [Hyphomicrobium sp. D-2]|uniref:hypothetical protein n=1 Tax=Hyphomicrobium sp. D-2 TaxID=3041621 RepID=UPI002458B1C5|nr:hypothetical protein [Hyphomicrobium sp. D-2]MDH4981248.1 hypothetical protein [Hyphomicrobium sp. D-2]
MAKHMNDNIAGTVVPTPKRKPRKAKAAAPRRTKRAPKAVPPSPAEIDAARAAAIRQELLLRDANAWREYLGKSPRIECHLYRIECIARLVDDLMMLQGGGRRTHDIQDGTFALIGDLLHESKRALWNGLELMDCNAFNQPAPAWLPSHRPATIPAPPVGRA